MQNKIVSNKMHSYRVTFSNMSRPIKVSRQYNSVLQEFEKVIPTSFQINSLVDKCHKCYLFVVIIYAHTYIQTRLCDWPL